MSIADYIILRLDRLWSRKVKMNAGGMCEVHNSIAGRKEEFDCECNGLQAHHIVGRRSYWWRWLLKNGVAVCPNLHTKPWLIRKWLKGHDPARYAWIKEEKNRIHKKAEIDIEEIEDELLAA
jgi:hypothetical protein